MAAPAIGKRRQWAPPPTARLDTSHPLAPGCGWIPSMGLQTIHGDPVTALGANRPQFRAGIGGRHHLNGPGGAIQTSAGFPNRVRGTLNAVTLAWWGTTDFSRLSAGYLFTNRTTSFPASGLCGSLAVSANFTMQWNDAAATYNFNSTIPMSGQMMVVAVVSATDIKFYRDGLLISTNTVANTALDFANLTGATAWGTADGSNFSDESGALYLVWPRALSAGEVAQIWSDPFCYMRW